MNACFDVFNGDADGLCALHQLRLGEPRDSRLITGVKRDNALLARVQAGAGDTVTALDLPLGRNLEALQSLLAAGVRVEYFDHHHAPKLPSHPLLQLTIDTSAQVCTSILVDRHLQGRFRAWAVVGAFGDNLAASAHRLAASLGLEASAVQGLQELGECLNYNAYGDTEADLAIPPSRLYAHMAPYADPFDFLAQEEVYALIAQGRSEDMAQAMDLPAMLETARLMVVLMPDAAWVRRVVGAYANRLQALHPTRVCAVLAPNSRGTLTVSLRAPAGADLAADQLARLHGGDGRRTAAGINDLPPQEMPRLVDNLRRLAG